MIDLKKAKTAELEAELALYTEGGVEVPADLKNNAERVAAIEKLRADEGVPVKVDAQFREENAALVAILTEKGEELTDGEIIFLEEAEITAAEERKAEEARAKAEHDDAVALVLSKVENPSDEFKASLEGKTTEDLKALAEQMQKELDNPSGGSATPPPPQKPSVASQGRAGGAVAAKDGVELVYLGRTVIRHHDKLLAGKTYKEVHTADGQAYTLSPEEFNRDVKPRA